MKKKTVLVIGILAIIIVFGTVIALAQNSSEKKKDMEAHECTPEMMKDGGKGHSGMMGDEKSEGENNDTASKNHCENMDSGMGSMMSSSGADTKTMM